MNILLDTHAFLWFINGDKKLSKNARELIEDSHNHRYLSMASLWEMTIKSSLGKLQIILPITELYQQHIVQNDIELLPIDVAYLDTLHNLPFHHGDPFDRTIIAQAIVENMPIISCDTAFNDYDVKCLW